MITWQGCILLLLYFAWVLITNQKYMRIVIVTLSMLFFSNVLYAQKTDKRLEKDIRNLVEGFKGQAGIYVYDLKRNKEVALHADTVFTTASMIKIPILIGVMDKLQKGELAYDQELIYTDSLLYAGADLLGSYKNGEKIELGKAIMLMLTMSDNTASLWLQSLAGTGTRINTLLDSMGYTNTRVNSRTPGREAIRNRYGWGQTSPREMAGLMRQIAGGTMINSAASSKMLRLLSRNFWDQNALSQIPAGVFVASKNGAVDASRSEVVFVNGKDCSYVFCICTQNNTDTSWKPDNEAWVLTRKLSALLWKHFNPQKSLL